jgi:hypothetical protein
LPGLLEFASDPAHQLRDDPHAISSVNWRHAGN